MTKLISIEHLSFSFIKKLQIYKSFFNYFISRYNKIKNEQIQLLLQLKHIVSICLNTWKYH